MPISGGLAPDTSRVQVQGFGRSTSAKAVWAARRGRAAGAARLRDGSDDDIIETEKTVIQMRKLTDFLLKPGAKHSQEFFDVGYTEKDTAQLAADIAAQYNEDKRVDFKIADNGTEKFSVFMELGKKERKLFQTVWQIDLGSEKPRLITSHRVSRKKGGEGK